MKSLKCNNCRYNYENRCRAYTWDIVCGCTLDTFVDDELVKICSKYKKKTLLQKLWSKILYEV